jgi:glutathione peroxidase
LPDLERTSIMKDHLKPGLAALFLLTASACGAAPEEPSPADRTTAAGPEVAGPVVDHQVTSLTGEAVDLTAYRGRVMLIVNTASECGYTPQYAGLQTLHERYGERGLVVIGFPSNDFGNQEPGEADEIASFCRLNYGVSFPMMAKVHTKGAEQAPIYRTLTTETGAGIRGEIRWNFTKFLIDPQGHVVARFEPGVEPLSDEIVAAIEGLLPTGGRDQADS